MDEICVGCGAKIQTEDENRKGYISKAVLSKRPDDFYCQRCFTLKHYNRNIDYPLDSIEYQDTINMITKNKGLIVYVCDLFDLEGTLNKDINKIYNSKNILIVANKVDLFLNSININKVEMYIRSYLKKIDVDYIDLLLISSFNHNDIIELVDAINYYRKNKDVYFVGMTNVGKSSLINQIVKLHTNMEDLITVSNMINTTLDNIIIPLDDSSNIIDTPGIINKVSINNFVSKDTLQKLIPDNYVKPKTFQLNPEQSLFVAGFVRVDFVSGERSSFVTNFRNDLLIHRTKLENADDFYNKHFEDILHIPTKQEIKDLGNPTERVVNISRDNKIDIVICGVGFITILGEGLIAIKSFENIKIIIRKAIL